MKRFFTALLAASLSFSAAPPVFAEVIPDEPTHQCGENLFWTLEDDGRTFHITGTGEMDISAQYGQNNLNTPSYEDTRTVQTVQIDEGCTSISPYMFAGWDNVDSVYLPDSLLMIGDYAFNDCEALQEISLPAGLLEIGTAAFSSTSLTEIILPDGIRDLPYECFLFCVELKKVQLPARLETIGESCFMGCPLTEMTIPDSVRYISPYVFWENSEWYRQFDDMDYVILGKCLFSVRPNSTGRYTVPDGVAYICAFAFPYDDITDSLLHIEALTLPDSIEGIDAMAFDNTDFLENYPDEYVIFGGDLLYRYLGNARVVRIPEGVKHISDSAFSGNRTIISLHFPESVRSIGYGAFEYANIQEVYLNDGLESIGERAFYCCGLTGLRIPESVAVIEYWAVNEGGSFQITGTPGSEAEAFAKRNHNTFLPYNAPYNVGYDMTPVYGKDNFTIGNGSDYFGDSYYLSDEAREYLLANNPSITEEDLAEPFIGSCYGLSLCVILAKAGLLAPAALTPGAKTLAEVTVSEQSLSVINYYFFAQHTAELLINPTTALSPEVKLLHMIRIAENVRYGEIPFLLSFSFVTGNHAVVGYGIEEGEWEWNDETYNNRILIWDPNFPGALYDGSCLYYNSETLDFCIPYYNVYYAGNEQTAVGKLNSFTNNLSMMYAKPYPFAQTEGDLNGNGAADIADAVLLCRTLTESAGGSTSLLQTADFDGDGTLTLLDLRCLFELVIAA